MPEERILIIEDDPALAESLQDGLSQAGYLPFWESTGTAGVAHARKNSPHLIILDLQLPDGSGFDFCRQIRRMKLYQPILMLTVQGNVMDRVIGLEMGADDYLVKPYNWHELLSRIRALLRRAYGEFSASEAERLYAGDLIVDLTKGIAHRGEQTINLSPTEFRLFVHLLRHPGQVFSRAQLLDAVWDYDVSPENERLVNVYVRRLREKVEHFPSQPSLILTVPGIGYRLKK